jgi:hypothetical protein
MAFLDGTGPRGQGPMTGRGMGNCTGANRVGSRAGYGFGRGRGAGFGMGNGLGLGRSFISPKNNLQVLESEKQSIEEELEVLREEIETLKKQK